MAVGDLDPRTRLPAAVAQTLGVGSNVVDPARVIAESSVLLVLDNMPDRPDLATSVVDLLRRCPRLQGLLTSRSILQVPDETAVTPASLTLPETVSADSVAAGGAVHLLAQRIAAMRPGFEVRPGNAAALAELCRRLDGIPLRLPTVTAASGFGESSRDIGPLSDRRRWSGRAGDRWMVGQAFRRCHPSGTLSAYVNRT